MLSSFDPLDGLGWQAAIEAYCPMILRNRSAAFNAGWLTVVHADLRRSFQIKR